MEDLPLGLAGNRQFGCDIGSTEGILHHPARNSTPWLGGTLRARVAHLSFPEQSGQDIANREKENNPKQELYEKHG